MSLFQIFDVPLNFGIMSYFLSDASLLTALLMMPDLCLTN